MINKILKLFTPTDEEKARKAEQFKIDVARKAEQLKVEAEAMASKRLEEKVKAGQSLAELYLNRSQRFLSKMPNHCFLPYVYSELHDWAKAEQDYAAAGFRTISLDRLRSANCNPHNLIDDLCVLREPGEKPIFHAELFQLYYVTSVASAFALRDLYRDSGTPPNSTIYPSTEKLAAMLKAASAKNMQ